MENVTNILWDLDPNVDWNYCTLRELRIGENLELLMDATLFVRHPMHLSLSREDPTSMPSANLRLVFAEAGGFDLRKLVLDKNRDYDGSKEIGDVFGVLLNDKRFFGEHRLFTVSGTFGQLSFYSLYPILEEDFGPLKNAFRSASSMNQT